MKSIQIKPSLFFKLYDYFIYGTVECHDDICNELMEKMEKINFICCLQPAARHLLKKSARQ